jgi:hypothetical protein
MSLDRMTEADRPQVDGSKRGLPGAALAAIALGLGSLGMAVATSDDQFARGLEAAIAAGPGAQVTARQLASSATPPIAGSEAFWLGNPSASVPLQPVTFHSRAISPGDRFQFGGVHDQRILEVTDVRQMPAQEGAATYNGKGLQLLMVTLRDVSSPETSPVRMLLDADAPIAGLTPLGNVRPADL